MAPRDTDERASDTSLADQVVEGLLAEGTDATPGRFGLDREVARKKLRDFQLAEPWTYPLDLLGAAFCLGATWIDLEVVGAGLRVRFDGHPLSETDFRDLYDALFSGGDDETLAARRQLAMAIGAAQGLGAAEIRISSGDGQAGAFLVARAEGADEIGALEPAPRFTEIQLEHGRQGRGGLSAAQADARLCQAIRERGIYTGAKVTLNGEPLPDGWALPEALATVPFGSAERGGPLRGVIGAVPRAPRGQLHLVVNGVQVQALEHLGLPAGIVGVVTDSRFRTDLGRGAVLRGRPLETAEAAAREILPTLLTRLDHQRVETSYFEPTVALRIARARGASTEREETSLPPFYLSPRGRGAVRALEATKRGLRLFAWGIYVAPALAIPKLVLWLAGSPAGDYLVVAFVLWVMGFFALLDLFLLFHFLAGPRSKRKLELGWVSGGQTLTLGLKLLVQRAPVIPTEDDLRELRRGGPAKRCLLLRGRIAGTVDHQGGDSAVLRDTWHLAGGQAARLTAMQRFGLDLEDGSGALVEINLPTSPWLAATYDTHTLPAALHPDLRTEAAGWLDQRRLWGGLDALLAEGRAAALLPGDEIDLVVPRGARIAPSPKGAPDEGSRPCVIQLRRRIPAASTSNEEPS